MAKRDRERGLADRRLEKQARKAARKLAAQDGTPPPEHHEGEPAREGTAAPAGDAAPDAAAAPDPAADPAAVAPDDAERPR